MHRSSPNTRVLVLDAFETVQWGIRLALNGSQLARRCIGASSLPHALAAAQRYEPHIGIVGQVRGGGQAHALAELHRHAPSMRLLALAEPRAVLPHADATVPATAPIGQLADAIRDLTPHEPVPGQPARAPALSQRQQQVLAGLSSGMTNHEIAASLAISTDTVKWHVKTLCRRLGARNRAEAVARAHARRMRPAA